MPAANGKPNYVHIDLKPEYAKSIPAAVTARVVPSNVFAVSSVQLVGNGSGVGRIRAGAHIPEDTRLPTVLFQTTVSKLRDLLAARGRGREDKSVGILAALAAATDHRRVHPAECRGAVESPSGSTQFDRRHRRRPVDRIRAASTRPGALQATAPDLVDALHQAVEPMQTFAETRGQLDSLLSGADHTVGTTRQSLSNHIDQLIQITNGLHAGAGCAGDEVQQLSCPRPTKLDNLANKFMDEVWMPETQLGNMRAKLVVHPQLRPTPAPTAPITASSRDPAVSPRRWFRSGRICPKCFCRRTISRPRIWRRRRELSSDRTETSSPSVRR